MAIARLAFSFDAGTHAVIQAMLESEGIAVLDVARGSHVSIAGVDQGYYIYVLDDDRYRAERLLRERGFGKHLVERDNRA